jgi:hypothetical protein
MSLKAKLDALPGWPEITRLGNGDATDADYWCDEAAAALARLAVAREWIERPRHFTDCKNNTVAAVFCRRCETRVLKALEVPNG